MSPNLYTQYVRVTLLSPRPSRIEQGPLSCLYTSPCSCTNRYLVLSWYHTIIPTCDQSLYVSSSFLRSPTNSLTDPLSRLLTTRSAYKGEETVSQLATFRQFWGGIFYLLFCIKIFPNFRNCKNL